MRATVRKYTSQPIGEELLNSLLEKASHTQTMGNLQLYSVVVTRDQEMKERLAPAHFSQPMLMQAPVVLTFCADFRRTTDWALNRQGHPGYDNFLSYQNATTDAMLFCQRFCDLAEEEGLGLCFLGTTVYNPQLIIDVLRLPQLVFPVATITLGWPAETPKPSDRLPIEAIIHNETYSLYTPEDIDKHYAYKESLEENKHFVEINQKETLAQVFTDIRYTAEANEAMSLTLAAALRKQNFLGDITNGYKGTRPESLECDVVRFQNKKDRWVAFVGLLDGHPYEIFTGILDDDEGKVQILIIYAQVCLISTSDIISIFTRNISNSLRICKARVISFAVCSRMVPVAMISSLPTNAVIRLPSRDFPSASIPSIGIMPSSFQVSCAMVCQWTMLLPLCLPCNWIRII